ncbi:MAG: peptidase MA family metallohydrolase [Mycobacterium leprae]
MKLRGKWLYPAVLIVGAVALLVGAAVVFLSIYPGYMEQRFRDQLAGATTGADWRERSTGHFLIRYKENEPGLSEVEEALPTAYDTVSAWFGNLPDQIPVYLFPDVGTMESAVGYDFNDDGSASHIAGTLVVHSPATWSAAFRSQTTTTAIVTHELTHLAALRMAGNKLPKWMNEGIAPYVAGQFTAKSAQGVAERAHAGQLYTITEMNEAFRLPNDSGGKNRGLAYAEGASLVDYMVKTYGRDSLRQVLTGLGSGKSLEQAFRAALGVSAKELEAAWRNSL